MTLVSNTTARIPAQILIEATNDDPAPTTIDTVKLGLAADDVEADFQTYAGVAYDDTDARHVSIGVEGVHLKLLAYKRDTRDVERYDTWVQEKLVQGLKLVTHNNRIMPKTTSNLTPTKSQKRKPRFDGETSFNDFIPAQNSGDRPSVEELGLDP